MTETKFRQVAPGIVMIHLPLPMRPTIINVYLVRGGDEWALIDTGMNTGDSLTTFREVLDALDCDPREHSQIICTHHHPDHFGASRPTRS